MKQNEKKSVFENSKSFNATSKLAVNSINATFKNVFVICRQLEKLSKGDFNKIEGVEGISISELKVIASELKRIFRQRYAFDIPSLLKTGKYVIVDGQLHKYVTKSVEASPAFAIAETITTTARILSIVGVYNEFKSVIRADIKERKQRAKDSEQREKDFAVVAKVFGAECAANMNDNEIRDKANIIRKSK